MSIAYAAPVIGNDDAMLWKVKHAKGISVLTFTT